MSVTIEFPSDLEATLRERLAHGSQNVTAFVLEAVREKLSRSKTLDEICAPFAQSVAASGVSDDELDRLFKQARENVWQAKQSQRP
jgi:hypothetical protein